MGIVKAIMSSVGGGLADQWLEVIEPDEMSDTTVLVSGVPVRKDKRNGNVKGNSNIISNGSVVHVGPNMMMLLVDGGKIVDYSAQEGYYTVNNSSSPSMFSGQLGDAVADTFNRIKFGGTPSQKQQVFYINLQEIKGIKFGTQSPIGYFDNFYNAELFLRARGIYSIKITDPLKFYTEACPRSASKVDIKDINAQYYSEFMDALRTAISQMSVDGVRISNIGAKSRELSKYMATTLDEDWTGLRGIEVCSVGIEAITYDEESKKLINMRNQGAMMSDPTVREGFVQTSIAQGLQAAGSNTAGAGQAYMAMGMGMQGAGGFMSAASQTNAAQMQAQQAAQAQAQAAQSGGWDCSCGHKGNNGNFCANCGAKKPAPAGSWTCSCGQVNTGNFCQNCGGKNPDAAWKCSCGQENKGKFCQNCGAARP